MQGTIEAFQTRRKRGNWRSTKEGKRRKTLTVPGRGTSSQKTEKPFPGGLGAKRVIAGRGNHASNLGKKKETAGPKNRPPNKSWSVQTAGEATGPLK